MESISAQTFKDTMATVAQAVTVVTTQDGDTPIGLTVSAFQSVSAEPAIVTICIDKVVNSLGVFMAADGYTVNFLPLDQADVATAFATRGVDRFASTPWHSAPLGVGGPVLDVAYGHFECRVDRRLEVGDHWMILGEVVGSELASPDSTPLVYLNRRFVTAIGL
jgi:flavin reductase (DIM6/NTAB) family NADH-FMN oxidoreductase RutF